MNFRGKFIVATCKINDFLAIILEINVIINKWIKFNHRFRVYNHSSSHGGWCIATLKIVSESGGKLLLKKNFNEKEAEVK